MTEVCHVVLDNGELAIATAQHYTGIRLALN
jgi:hypothetical protein